MKSARNKWANVPQIPYIGRFAPSPTGPLHLGSLFTALASYLEARAQQGIWLLRIDDLDTPRNVPGAADSILRTLEAFGMTWDQEVSYQSRHLDAYLEALEVLASHDLTYHCICSRKFLAESHNSTYPNFCRDRPTPSSNDFALRIKTNMLDISFDDQLCGHISQNIGVEHGDFIIKRKDRIIAYQFAVVIDDHLQNITHVLRGADLLDSTIKQLYLHQCLNLNTPRYLHVPVLTGINGTKLSKKDHAPAVTQENSHLTLFKLLQLLQQNPPVELQNSSCEQLLQWAIKNWDVFKLSRISCIPV